MKFGVTVALFLALLAIVSAFKTENRLQLRQEDGPQEEEELTCDICTPDYCEANFYNWAGCCLADESCAENDDQIAVGCCRYPSD